MYLMRVWQSSLVARTAKTIEVTGDCRIVDREDSIILLNCEMRGYGMLSFHPVQTGLRVADLENLGDGGSLAFAAKFTVGFKLARLRLLTIDVTILI